MINFHVPEGIDLNVLNSLIFLDMKICRRVFVKFPVYQDASASNFIIYQICYE